MKPSDFESLIEPLRVAAPRDPDRFNDAVMARLGPPARQTGIVRITGTCVCVAAVVVSLIIGTSAAREPVATVPPELTLLSHAANPLLSW